MLLQRFLRTRAATHVLLAAVAWACVSSTSAQEPASWELLAPGTVDEPMRRAIESLAARVGSSAEPVIRFAGLRTVPDGETVLAAVRDAPALALVPLSAFHGEPRTLGVFDGLFVFRNLAAVGRYQASIFGVRQLLALESRGLEGLAFVHDGMVQLAARKPIDDIADLAGLRIGVSGIPASVAPQFKALGAQPQLLRTADRWDGLTTNAIDVAEFTWPELVPLTHGSGFEAIASNHRYRGYVLVANQRAFNALPPAVRERLEHEARSTAETLNAAAEQRESELQARVTSMSGRPLRPMWEADYGIVPELWFSAAWRAALGSEVLNVILGALQISQPKIAAALIKPILIGKGGNDAAWVRLPEVATLPTVALSARESGRLQPTAKSIYLAKESTVVPDTRWNIWAQRHVDKTVVYFLEPGLDYVLHLDLSRYAYQESQSTVATPWVKEVLRRELDAGRTNVRLKVRPHLLGESLRQPVMGMTEFNLDLTLDRLRGPTEEKALGESRLLAQLRGDPAAVPRLSQKLGAGSVAVPVSASLTPGCAQVVLSIWDESGLRPLDHIVHNVSVRRAGQPVPSCERIALQGDFKSLIGVLTTRSSHADAALQLIEVPTNSGTDTIALYVDAARYRRALADPTLADRGLYGWQLERPFSMEALVGQHHELLDLVNGARQSGSYRLAAESLAKKLFTATRETETQALAAVSALRAIPPTKRPPMLMLRASTARNVPVYLPFGLLGARDAGLLSGRITVVHPLPREDYGESCIDRWILGIPRTLDQVTGVITLPELPARMTRIHALDELKGFFGRDSSVLDLFRSGATSASPTASTLAPRPGRAEALVLLAHQSEGKLWFTDSGTGERIETTDLRRDFPPGSVAILAACSTANPTGDNQAVLELLNRRGIDAVVASPFPIEASFGVELAKAFVEAGRAAYGAGRTPELRELFDSALDIAAVQLGEQAPARDKALEFMILGNHQLRLCP